MFATRPKAPHQNPALAAMMTDMVKAVLRNFLLVLAGGFLLWFIIATATWPNVYAWAERGFLLLLIAICGLALRLLSIHWLLAEATWQGVMLLVITLGVWQLQRPEPAFLYLLLPFVAVVTVGWWAGLLMQGLIVALSLWLTLGTPAARMPEWYLTIVIGGGICTGLFGYVMARTLFTALGWYVFALERAEENLVEARLHRGNLVRVQKSLDEAYYQLKRTNAALTAAWKTADEAERFKAEFVTNVSHELRTPLNLILGFSEVMMTSPESYGNLHLPGLYRRDLNAIYHSAQHLLALVDDVLDLARIEVGKLVLTRNEVELAALVAETTAIVRDYIAAKGLALQVQVADDLPMLCLDRLRIRQVLLNLLVNAARFTDQGYIRLTVTRAGEEVLVRVIDSGRGIPAQELPRIFEEFRATEQPLSAWHSGAGLGLPISKKFVELSGGRMGVAHNLPRGAAFWFTLPYQTAAHHPTEQATPQRSKPLLTMPERVVVLVHEDPRLAAMLQRDLDGCQVLSATNPAEGIALAETTKALALLMDNTRPLPTLSRDLPRDLLLVQCPLPSGYQAAHRLGAMNLLVKPVTRHDLATAINLAPHPIRRILIADDDPEMVRVLRRMLYALLPTPAYWEAYTGAEALRLIQCEKPDLVLLDLLMPDQDGQSVLAQMAADPTLAAIPVIVISAKGQDYLKLPLTGSIQIANTQGFHFGEIVRLLDTTFKALAPGWYLAGNNAPAHVEESVDSRAWSDRHSPPTPSPIPPLPILNRQSPADVVSYVQP